MKIKFLKDFMATQSDDFRDLHAILIKRGGIVDVDGCEYNNSYFDMPKEQAQWLIDNGFAEEVKEPEWVRKQIKQIEFGEHKSVYVVVRFIKSQNYIGYDNELGDVIASNEPGEIKRIYFHADDNGSWRQKDYDTLNQMVRDGYIEIEDNPNIVWEDGND